MKTRQTTSGMQRIYLEVTKELSAFWSSHSKPKKTQENRTSGEVTMRCWELTGMCSRHWSQWEWRPAILQIQIAK